MGTHITKTVLPPKKNLSQWYRALVLQAELADYAPVRGSIVFRPWGYALWEKTQQVLDKLIKDMGVKNAYFPLFIPLHLLQKEADHVEGFSPELAVVTHGGGEKLTEPLAVRPTSETIMYAMFSRWITSWRDLPLKINQWANVVRWEKRTYPFLRTSEFLWQEGHTAHATHAQAQEQVLKALHAYRQVFQDTMALWGIMGWKSESEKFAGALKTTTYEILMPDGKALQSATSHDLGQHFAKAFDITFQDKEGKTDYVWQTSWGLSTRSLGALIMVHGDDNGLFLPPNIAPLQIVIVPIYKSNNQTSILAYSQNVAQQLQNLGFRVHIDDRDTYSPGWKFNYWEVKGVPLRIEIGSQEQHSQTLTLVRRDNFSKESISFQEIDNIKNILTDQQQQALHRHQQFTLTHTHQASDYAHFRHLMAEKKGFIKAFWCGNPHCEAAIKAETKATTRCLPLDAQPEKGRCVYCGKPSQYRWYFAQAY